MNEYVTIPFFATVRKQIDPVNPGPMLDQQDIPNVIPIPGSPNSAPTQTFFGCWLDINRPTPLFHPGAGVTERLGRAIHLRRSAHFASVHVRSASMLGCRNFLRRHQYSTGRDARVVGLACATQSGIHAVMIAARQVLSTFDIKPSATTADSELDELMIDWRSLPASAIASIYLPAVSADAIISAAGAMYGSQPFIRIDGNTISCDARGVTFMPIPRGSGNYAGLLSVELPNTIHRGDKYTITVNQITNAEATLRRPVARRRWRKLLGTFQLAVPVGAKAESLPAIEQNLALLLWIFSVIPLPTAGIRSFSVTLAPWPIKSRCWAAIRAPFRRRPREFGRARRRGRARAKGRVSPRADPASTGSELADRRIGLRPLR